MAKGLDLNKLKSEIETRKKEKGMLTENAQGVVMPPRDAFLNGLLKSLQTGSKSPMINNIKTMSARADIISDSIKKGVVTTEAINKLAELKSSGTVNIAPTEYRAPKMNETAEMLPERDETMLDDFNTRRKNVTLADSMKDYVGKTVPTPMPVTSTGAPINLNEGYLVENVKKIVDNYLVDNFGLIVEEAIKDTVIEMYAVERIKEVLYENKELVKSLIKEVIREIQDKSKQNKAQS